MDLEARFAHHVPTNTQPDRIERINLVALAFSEMVQDTTPPGREQSLSLTAIHEAALWATTAIMVNE